MRYCLPRLSALASLSFVILLLAACRTTPPAPSGSQLPASQVQQLKNMRLAQQLPVPVQGIKRHGLTDTWGASRSSGRTHEGIDILAPRGTKVFSATEGLATRSRCRITSAASGGSCRCTGWCWCCAGCSMRYAIWRRAPVQPSCLAPAGRAGRQQVGHGC